MIFPIGDDNIIGGHKPLVSYSLILINIFIFVYELRLGLSAESLITHYGMIPAEIWAGKEYYTILSSMFLHAGWMHLIGNMLFLWIFADNIEAVIGSARFSLFYFIGGTVAALIHMLADPLSMIPSVGASGAISAVMGAYLILFPRSRVKLVFIIFFTRFHLPATLFLGFWFLQQLSSGMGSIGQQGMGGIAWWAHIGGFVYGILAGYIIKRAYGHLYYYGDGNPRGF